MFDPHANFGITTVVTPPTPATSGTTVVVLDGTVFPATPFNVTVWPIGATPTNANAEIMRVTNVSGNTLTVTRQQETNADSVARAILVGDQIANTITVKVFTDLETIVGNLAGPNDMQNILAGQIYT